MIGSVFLAVHAFELVVLRHGRTAWNAAGRFQGHTDVSLDEAGRAQARALAALLAGEEFDLAFSSDLARARETAEIVLAGRGLALMLEPRWREMQFGTWEGLAWPEIVARYPDLASRSATKPKFYTPDGGETFEALCARVRSALESIDARVGERAVAKNAGVLVATHAGPLHALLHVALGEDEAAALAVKFVPASLTRLRFEPSAAQVLELNVAAPAARVL